MSKGPAQTPSRRTRVFSRDGWKCLRCGAEAPLTLDHIRPVSQGGPTRKRNLQTLCAPCNQRKADRRVDYRPTAKASPYHVSRIGDRP